MVIAIAQQKGLKGVERVKNIFLLASHFLLLFPFCITGCKRHSPSFYKCTFAHTTARHGASWYSCYYCCGI